MPSSRWTVTDGSCSPTALAEELFGYAREELLGRPVTMLWAARVRKRYQRNLELYFATQHPLRFTAEAWGLRRDGTEFIGEMSWGIVERSAGRCCSRSGATSPSAARATTACTRSPRWATGRSPAPSPPSWRRRPSSSCAAGCPSTARGCGSTTAARSRTPARSAAARCGCRSARATSSSSRPRGELTDEEMGIVRAVANTLTVALARLRDEAQMRHDAVHDPLTHLANRILLRDRLEQARARSEREGGEIGVLFVDLDGFKAINDTHGHGAGDAVLVEFGARLKRAVRPADTVARVGGDEFVVVCDQIDDAAVRSLATRLQDAIRPPVSVG